MDEIYVTYVDDEHVGNHDYEETTDDYHDNSNDFYNYSSTAHFDKNISYKSFSP